MRSVAQEMIILPRTDLDAVLTYLDLLTDIIGDMPTCEDDLLGVDEDELVELRDAVRRVADALDSAND